jgi:DNA invertase Pin-like site-specific DNA recombinase
MPRFELTQKWKKERHVWRELPEGSRVVIYGRHSPGESQSIDSQAHAMRRWVEERGWPVAREFYDEGIEGSRDDRLAFQEMLAFLHQTPRPVEGIVTWNTSRFGRDQLDSQFYKADLRRRGYVILGKEDGIEQSPLAPMLESMLEWKAQQDLAVIGADTKRGLEYLALQGYWPGGPLPIGYVSDKELIGHRKNGAPRYGNRIRKDPAVADRIQRAWEMRLAGASYRDIHDAVRLYDSSKYYSTFFQHSLYTGVLDYGGKRYPATWATGDRFCEPYITLEQFDAVRDRARTWSQRRGPGVDQHPRNRVSGYLLSGLAVCGVCLQRGQEVSLAGWTDPRRPSFSSYRCGRKQRVRGSACTLRSVPCWLLEDTIFERVAGEIFTPEYIRAEVTRANAVLAARGGDRERQLRLLEAAEARARNALENLARFIAANGGNSVIEEHYRVADREWKLASAALQSARAERRQTRPLKVTEADAREYASNLVAHMHEGDVALRRRFLAAFIKRVVIYDDDGVIELTDSPSLGALNVAKRPENSGGWKSPSRWSECD